jgi:hypothetical protein
MVFKLRGKKARLKRRTSIAGDNDERMKTLAGEGALPAAWVAAKDKVRARLLE